MLYLEDYLEMIEHLPQELRDRFTEMREMDLQVQNSMDSLEDRIQQLFFNAKKFKLEQRDSEYEKIKQDYYKSLEDADEKVNMANQMYDLVDKYLRRLDQELQKFKMELEADNAGITEILEKRSLELDNPAPSGLLLTITNNHQPKSEKRKYTTSQTSYSSTNGNDKRAEKALNALAVQEVLQESLIKYRPQQQPPQQPQSLTTGVSQTHHQSASTSPFSSNHGSPIPSAAPPPPPQPPTHLINLGHMAAGSNAIAAAASQAIAATQQMQQGRRTASLKASFQVINSGMPSAFNKELTIGREVGAAGLNAIMSANAPSPAAVQVMSTASTSASAVPGSIGSPATTTPNLASGIGLSGGSSFTIGGGGGGGGVAGLGGLLNPTGSVGASSSSASSSSGNSSMTVAPSLSPVPELKFSRPKKQTKSSSNVVELPVEPPVLSPEECIATHIMMDEAGQPVDWTFDPNEPRYCVCNQVSYGDMVACDNEDCPVEWFHYNCVGITQPPRGKWYCPQCTAAMRRRGRKDK